jgi:hypothetical protein
MSETAQQVVEVSSVDKFSPAEQVVDRDRSPC